jgi:hypothetical protein
VEGRSDHCDDKHGKSKLAAAHLSPYKHEPFWYFEPAAADNLEDFYINRTENEAVIPIGWQSASLPGKLSFPQSHMCKMLNIPLPEECDEDEFDRATYVQIKELEQLPLIYISVSTITTLNTYVLRTHKTTKELAKYSSDPFEREIVVL